MRHFTFVFCSIFTTLAFSQESVSNLQTSLPDQVATLNSTKGELIGGIIHPLSGYPYLQKVDLIAKGAEEIQLSRYYIGSYLPVSFHPKKEWDQYYLIQHLGKNNRGWQYLPHGAIKVVVRNAIEVYVPDTYGAISHFTLSGPNYSLITLASPPYAVSNLSGETPGGQFDVRNTQILYEDKGSKITVTTPDGTERLYCFLDEFNPYQVVNSGRIEYFCRLMREKLPNGKILKYHYDEQKNLTLIESLDPQEKNVYASIRVKGSPSSGKVHFLSSSATEATYTYHKEKLEIKFKEKVKKERHEVQGSLSTQFLTSVSSPFYRYENTDYTSLALLSGYFGEKEAFMCTYIPYNDGSSQHYKVKNLDLPVGVNDTFLPVYEFNYDQPIQGKKEGKTTVKNSDGTSTVYRYSKDLLLAGIQYFAQDGSLQKQKRYSWDENNWLKAIELLDGNNTALYRKSYEYDSFGNPILETFTGDLTGNGSLESSVIKREFSEDGRHLLLREVHESGKTFTFEYLPSTNLITKKLTSNGSSIVLREFFSYDDCCNLIRKIIDDGSSSEVDDLTGITERKITNYALRTRAPFLHMIESISESYLEQGEEKLLKQTRFTYDSFGNISKEEHFDAKGTLSYVIHKTWNERGDLLSETNPLGQVATYTYDERGRCIASTPFSGNLKNYMYYDVRNRLRELSEVGEDEVSHTLSYHYDYHDRLIYKADQNWIGYTFDPLCDQIIKTDFPPIASTDEEPLSVITSSVYDAFGREIQKTSANGLITYFAYNAYGSPTSILYPDGSQETFRYTKEGNLQSHTDQEGKTTLYEYDIWGRVGSKSYKNETANLGQETYAYTSFRLIRETDLEKNVTTYKYDGAGRKIYEDIHGKCSDFTYNSLGQLSGITRRNRENTLFISYERDLMGRILDESYSDQEGTLLHKIAYSYDQSGNIGSITRFLQDKRAIETFLYDSFDRVIVHTDPLGVSTTTSYNESYTNELRQKVLQTTTASQMGTTTIVTYDPYHRVVKREVLGSNGSTLSCQELFYDQDGNLLETRDDVYEELNQLRTLKTTYGYNALNQMESLTLGAGSADERTFGFSYTPKGNIETKTLVCGTTLLFTYDAYGHLQTLTSSDGQINYEYVRNRLGYLLKAYDHEKGIALERQVDSFGNTLSEKFSNRSVVTKTYDAFDRPLTVNLAGPNFSNQGKIFYSYDPYFLRTVTRQSPQGISYCHRYNQYDLNGTLTNETPIGTLGAIIYAHDLNGHKTSMIHPSFTEKYLYDTAGNLIRAQSGDTHVNYEYDSLYHLRNESKKADTYEYRFDSLGNRLEKNGERELINDLGELISTPSATFTYDLNGNLAAEHSSTYDVEYSYDPLGRMIQAKTKEKEIEYVYDPLNRQFSKTVFVASPTGLKKSVEELYLHDGMYEVGSFHGNGALKTLRVLGLPLPQQEPVTVAIEMNGKVLAPMIDAQGMIRRLVDTYSNEVVYTYNPTSFGEPWKSITGSQLSPWSYSSKRFDSDLNLFYFNGRYYDPKLGRFLNHNDPIPE